MLVAFTPFFFVTLTSNKIRELLLRIALLRVLGSIVDYLVHHASCIMHQAQGFGLYPGPHTLTGPPVQTLYAIHSARIESALSSFGYFLRVHSNPRRITLGSSFQRRRILFVRALVSMPRT